MAKYAIEGKTLLAVADAIRFINGETKKYTPLEMEEAVKTIMDSTTYMLVDAAGNEIPAIYVNPETVFTATENDIREGLTAATDDGVIVGTKDIPSYHTTEGFKAYPNGYDMILYIPDYDYTKLQAVFCAFNTSLTDSVGAEKIAINDKIYPVQSTEAESEVIVDYDNGRIDFGIKNESGKPCIVRYITYKEIY